MEELILDMLVRPSELVSVGSLQGCLEGGGEVVLHPGLPGLLDREVRLCEQLQSIPLEKQKFKTL